MDFKRDLVTAIKRQTDTNLYTYSDMHGSRGQSTGGRKKEGR